MEFHSKMLMLTQILQQLYNYKVRGVPTIVIEKDGQEVKRIVGATTQAALTSTINSFK